MDFKFCNPDLTSLCDRPPFGIMGCKYLRMLVALALVDSVKPNCLIEHNTDYVNLNNLNWGPNNPQPKWESCRSSCESNHPTATHFVYKKSGIWAEDCWCKTSKSGRTSNSNAVSGEVCRGKKIVTFYGKQQVNITFFTNHHSNLNSQLPERRPLWV